LGEEGTSESRGIGYWSSPVDDAGSQDSQRVWLIANWQASSGTSFIRTLLIQITAEKNLFKSGTR
jgi:hypothetical protein